LYVTQRDGVLVFPPSTYISDYDVRRYTFSRTPKAKLVDRNDPTDVAIGPDGDIYVAEQGGPQSANGGAVAVFAPKTTTPAYTISFGKGTYVDGVTLDAANNLYVTWRDAVRSARLNISPPPAPPALRQKGTDADGITGDLFRGVLYSEKFAAIVYANYPLPDISTYPEINHHKPFDKLGSPDYIAFNERESQVFVPDFAHNQIEIYDFPSGTINYAFDGLPHGAPAGCALLPAPPL
jgi:sugar lactone lactonase YvrE